MKFLPFEYQDVKAAIEQSGLSYHAFTFVKKKGRLHIQFLDQPPPFIFFRKEETRLNAEKQWEKITTYYTGRTAERHVAGSWQKVLNDFRLWLQDVSANNEVTKKP